MVKGPDVVRMSRVEQPAFLGVRIFFFFCEVSKEQRRGERDARRKLRLGIANSQVASGRGLRVVDGSLLCNKRVRSKQTHRNEKARRRRKHINKETRCINAGNGCAVETIYNCYRTRSHGESGGHMYVRLSAS